MTRTVWQPNFSGLIFRFGGAKLGRKQDNHLKSTKTWNGQGTAAKKCVTRRWMMPCQAGVTATRFHLWNPPKKHASCGQTRPLVLWNCRSNFLASSSSRFRALFPQFRPRHGTCYAVHRGCGLDPHGNLALPVTVFFMDGNAMVQSYTTAVHEFHISYSDWLVVSNMAFIFHFICGISSQPHWRTHIFQRGCGQMISRIQDDPRSFWSQIIDRPVMNLPS